MKYTGKNKLQSFLGTFLLISGTLVSVAGVIANNLMLDHILAMRIWTLSNFLLLFWAIGFWRKWWTNGIGALFLVAMYAIYCVTNEIGLMNS